MLILNDRIKSHLKNNRESVLHFPGLFVYISEMFKR